MLALFMQSPQHAVEETSQYVAVIKFIGTRMLIRIRWVCWHGGEACNNCLDSFFISYPLISFISALFNSHGSGEAAQLTSILASDSLESFWMCERSKAMLAARWTCTTIRRDERWERLWVRGDDGAKEKINRYCPLLSSLKPDFGPWEPSSFCFYFVRANNEK
jgi:hypothetical protein